MSSEPIYRYIALANHPHCWTNTFSDISKMYLYQFQKITGIFLNFYLIFIFKELFMCISDFYEKEHVCASLFTRNLVNSYHLRFNYWNHEAFS